MAYEFVDDEFPLPSFDSIFGEIQRNLKYNKKKQTNRKPKDLSNTGDETTGRWTAEEHKLFLEGIMLYGKDWKKMQPLIKTRTLVQIRTHAQKVFKKIGLNKIGKSNKSIKNRPLEKEIPTPISHGQPPVSADDHHVLLQHVSQQLMETSPTQNDPSSQPLSSSSSLTHSSHSPNSVSSNITTHNQQPPQNKEPSPIQPNTELGSSTDPTNLNLTKQAAAFSQQSQESTSLKDQDSQKDSPKESKIKEPPALEEETKKNNLCNELKRSIQDIEGEVSQQDLRLDTSLPPIEPSQPSPQANSSSQFVLLDESNSIGQTFP